MCSRRHPTRSRRPLKLTVSAHVSIPPSNSLLLSRNRTVDGSTPINCSLWTGSAPRCSASSSGSDLRFVCVCPGGGGARGAGRRSQSERRGRAKGPPSFIAACRSGILRPKLHLRCLLHHAFAMRLDARSQYVVLGIASSGRRPFSPADKHG